jgi:hypothetical protein
MTSYSASAAQSAFGSASFRLTLGVNAPQIGEGADTLGAAAQYGVVAVQAATGVSASVASLAIAIIQNAVMATTPSFAYQAGASVHERGKLVDLPSTNMYFQASVHELGRLTGIIYKASVVSITQYATLHDYAQAVMAVYVQERAKGGEALSAQATYNLYIAEAARAFITFTALAHRDVHEYGVMTDAVAKQYIAVASVFQRAVSQDFAITSMIFRLEADERGVMDDALALQMIWNGAVAEFGRGVITYQSPSGNTSSWVVNTRTNAVTQYTNWNFNSFTSMGRKYIATDQNGLYELNGERDLTSNIVADMMGGMVKFNGAKFAGMKGVYIGLSQAGQFYLKLTAGDGREYTYQFVANPGQMTSKVKIGKGLRSQYFQWELISTGSDFDLDTVEFVPMVSDRRV